LKLPYELALASNSPESHALAVNNELPQRRTPAKGVHVSPGGLNWIFLTVCTENRERWLIQPFVKRALQDIWKNKATAWLVSDYLLMPDHLHLFCVPHDLKFTIERWISYWKDCLAKTCPDAGTFQRGGFHHRLRDEENYHEKWLYVQNNPVRAGLAAKPEDWPYQGRVHEIHW
jgi:putative transposase